MKKTPCPDGSSPRQTLFVRQGLEGSTAHALHFATLQGKVPNPCPDMLDMGVNLAFEQGDGSYTICQLYAAAAQHLPPREESERVLLE